jgi:hypothetical protein
MHTHEKCAIPPARGLVECTNLVPNRIGLEHLKSLTKYLQCLDLEDTKVTDAGLEHLNGLTKLQVLNLRKTKVTDAAVKKLQQKLPNCKIAR